MSSITVDENIKKEFLEFLENRAKNRSLKVLLASASSVPPSHDISSGYTFDSVVAAHHHGFDNGLAYAQERIHEINALQQTYQDGATGQQYRPMDADLEATMKYKIADAISIEGRSKVDIVHDVLYELRSYMGISPAPEQKG